MSDPGGSSRLCIGDRGTQRIARGDNLRTYGDEEISSSSFEDVPSRVDVVGVMMRFKPIGES